jgi:hypothetical protein
MRLEVESRESAVGMMEPIGLTRQLRMLEGDTTGTTRRLVGVVGVMVRCDLNLSGGSLDVGCCQVDLIRQDVSATLTDANRGNCVGRNEYSEKRRKTDSELHRGSLKKLMETRVGVGVQTGKSKVKS